MLPALKQLLSSSSSTNLMMIGTRCLATQSSAVDPIQKLFVDKIKEYSNKAKNAPGGLVDSNPDVMKKFKEDMERVANAYGIKDESNIANLGLKFEETTKIDPINMK